MIGNYLFVVTVSDSTLSATYRDIENALKQGCIVAVVNITSTKTLMSFVLSTERGEGEYTVSELSGTAFVTDDLDGYPVLSE